MKKTEQSYNSTLKSHSLKRARNERLYFKLIAQLKAGCKADDYSFRSELPPHKKAAIIYDDIRGAFPVLEAHHIDGREGSGYLDPFNIIMLLPVEHDDFTNERGVAKLFNKAQLKNEIREVRLAQGFKPL